MPKMLVRKVRSICAALMSSSRSCGCCSAALLTSRSSRPNASTARATASRQKRLVAEVARDRDAAPILRLDPALGRAGVVVLVEVEDRDVGPLLGETDRDRAADAAVAAGDQRGLAGELAGAPVVLHVGLRLGRHRRAQAGLAVLLLGGVVRGLGLRHGLALSWAGRRPARRRGAARCGGPWITEQRRKSSPGPRAKPAARAKSPSATVVAGPAAAHVASGREPKRAGGRWPWT